MKRIEKFISVIVNFWLFEIKLWEDDLDVLLCLFDFVGFKVVKVLFFVLYGNFIDGNWLLFLFGVFDFVLI